MIRRLFYIFTLLLFVINTKAQKFSSEEEKKCFSLLDKALGQYIESDNTAIYFKSIAFDVSKPDDFFKLPVYKSFIGGHMLVLGDKYEIQIGIMKALCDGKLCVFVDETQKMMFVDSLKHISSTDTSIASMDKLMDESINDAVLNYIGEVNVGTKKCHKIKTLTKGKMGGEVIYYVDVVTGEMVLMAEKQGMSYTVYQFDKISKVPKEQQFTIYLPKKEMQNFHGYEVIDNRYLNINSK